MVLEDFTAHFRRSFPDLLGRRLLVAVSGGSDSTALLYLLQNGDLASQLEVAHVHHGTRGAEADADQEFCRDLAGRLGLRFHPRRLETEASPPDGREAGWRRARYRVLAELARELDAAAVATGHQRDDIAEGVLVQMLRGAGPRALAGIAERTGSGLARPLLPWRRRELRGWLEARGLRWREDSSNLNLEHLRNEVRHHILPTLELTSPRVVDHLVALAAALAESEDSLAASAARLVGGLDPWDPEAGVEIAHLEAVDRAIRTRWLQAEAARWDLTRTTRRQLELMHALVEGGDPPTVTLGKRWRLRRARGRVWLEPHHSPGPWSVTLTDGEAAELGVPGWQARLGSATTGRARYRAALPATGRLTVRSALPDDAVIALDGPQRVARLLAAALPVHLRSAWPVVLVDATICWIPGVWLDPNPGIAGVMVMEVDRP